MSEESTRGSVQQGSYVVSGSRSCHGREQFKTAVYWLTVQSLCEDMERAKQWLSRNHEELTVSLANTYE